MSRDMCAWCVRVTHIHTLKIECVFNHQNFQFLKLTKKKMRGKILKFCFFAKNEKFKKARITYFCVWKIFSWRMFEISNRLNLYLFVTPETGCNAHVKNIVLQKCIVQIYFFVPHECSIHIVCTAQKCSTKKNSAHSHIW